MAIPLHHWMDDERPWVALAACRDADPELFFSDGDGRGTAVALRICAGCPVNEECLEWALTGPGGVRRVGRHHRAGPPPPAAPQRLTLLCLPLCAGCAGALPAGGGGHAGPARPPRKLPACPFVTFGTADGPLRPAPCRLSPVGQNGAPPTYRGAPMTHHPIRPGLADPRDFLGIDALLDDEERLMRDTVRRFVADKVLPYVGDWFEGGYFPRELGREMGAMGLLGMHLEGYGCSGTSQRGLRPGLLRVGVRRFGHPLVRVGAGVAVDVPHLGLRVGGAEAAVAAGHGGRRPDRLLRPDRGRRRQRPVVDAHGGQARRVRLGAERLEDVDHQWRPQRPGGGVGQGRRGHPRLHRPPQHPRVHRERHPQEDVAAGVGHFGAGARRRAPARRRGAARGRRAEGPAVVPERGPLRHHVGGGGGGPGLLRGGPGLRQAADDVRQAHRRASSSSSASWWR